jgi:hypothetical protein
MSMAAGKWQQLRKQRLHQRRKQRPSGGGDTGSGYRGNIGTTMTVTTGNEDYDAGRALCHCRQRRLLQRQHDDNDGNCYDDEDHDDNHRKGGGIGGV